jgi:hypothetical protein
MIDRIEPLIDLREARFGSIAEPIHRVAQGHDRPEKLRPRFDDSLSNTLNIRALCGKAVTELRDAR